MIKLVTALMKAARASRSPRAAWMPRITLGETGRDSPLSVRGGLVTVMEVPSFDLARLPGR